MILLDFLAYIIMLVLAIILLGLAVLGFAICGTFIVGFFGGICNEFKNLFWNKPYVQLWFAFKIVSLTYQTHHKCIRLVRRLCCDLLLNLYLWHIKHILLYGKTHIRTLWFAFKFVSLTYQTHPWSHRESRLTSCDLLLNLYLWHIKHILA